MPTLGLERRVGDVMLRMSRGMLVVEETYTVQVFADNEFQTRLDILNTPDLPIPQSSISPSGLGVCQTTNCKRNPGNRLLWDVEVKYSSEVEDNSGQDFSQTGGGGAFNPETWVPRRETFLEPFEDYPIVDLDGMPFTNGAGTPFATGVPVKKDLLRYDFFQFEPTTGPNGVTDVMIAQRNNSINDDVFMGHPKHTLLLKVRKSTVGFYYGVERRLSEYSIVVQPKAKDGEPQVDNWHVKIANVGPQWISNDGGTLKKIDYRYKDSRESVVQNGPLGFANVPYNTPFVSADATPSGGVESDGGELFAREPAQPVLYYIERRVYEELDFKAIFRFPDA